MEARGLCFSESYEYLASQYKILWLRIMSVISVRCILLNEERVVLIPLGVWWVSRQEDSFRGFVFFLKIGLT